MYPKALSLNLFTQKIPNWLIFCCLTIIWLIVQYYYFQSDGVKTVPDSIFRYIPYAHQVAESGQLIESHENKYLIYIILLILFFKTKASLTGLVFFQVAISGVAAIYFYKTIKHLTEENRLAAFSATLLLILWKDIQYLNVYILTESLFTSSIIFVLYALVKSKTTKHYIAPITLSIIPALLRPNGFIVILGILVCLYIRNRNLLHRYSWIVVAGILGIIILLALILDKYLLTTFQIVETYARGEVIYASDVFLVDGKHVVLPKEKESPILRILYFIFLNPFFFFKLFFSKILIFITYMKPYYSLLHNISIAIIIYPLYFFTGWLKLRYQQYSVISSFAFTVFTLQACIVATTSEDWDSRFIIPLLPIVIASGTAGLYYFFKKKNLKSYTSIPSRSANPALPCKPPVCTATIRVPLGK